MRSHWKLVKVMKMMTKISRLIGNVSFTYKLCSKLGKSNRPSLFQELFSDEARSFVELY